jgi:hypothetical protein
MPEHKPTELPFLKRCAPTFAAAAWTAVQKPTEAQLFQLADNQRVVQLF